jgi:hypothetical protein
MSIDVLNFPIQYDFVFPNFLIFLFFSLYVVLFFLFSYPDLPLRPVSVKSLRQLPCLCLKQVKVIQGMMASNINLFHAEI